ncbi:MAG TPA: GNAT family N-acetyltransferase [Phycicoccus sp.]|nr:GNAT family N-acetyltransferase [Phycicoccus sp.]
MDLEIRRARADELDAVGALTVAAYAADGRITADHPYATHLADAVARYRDAVLLVAAGADGELLGTATIVPAGSSLVEMCRTGEMELRMLAVSPDARGGGIGERLASACVEVAREHGCERVILSSGTWMTAAHRLYERLGFVRVPERDWSPRKDVHLLAYELPLTRT